MTNLAEIVLKALASVDPITDGMTCREIMVAIHGKHKIPAINLTMYRLRESHQVRRSWRRNEDGENVWYFEKDTAHMNAIVLDWWNRMIELNCRG